MSKQDMPTTKGEKSKYAKKIIRKFGKGEIDPKWMWWLERSEQKAPLPGTGAE